jgi:hypothetical protein
VKGEESRETIEEKDVPVSGISFDFLSTHAHSLRGKPTSTFQLATDDTRIMIPHQIASDHIASHRIASHTKNIEIDVVAQNNATQHKLCKKQSKERIIFKMK